MIDDAPMRQRQKGANADFESNSPGLNAAWAKAGIVSRKAGDEIFKWETR